MRRWAHENDSNPSPSRCAVPELSRSSPFSTSDRMWRWPGGSVSDRTRYTSIVVLGVLCGLAAAAPVGEEKSVRILNGPLGPFAGDDFPCEEKNVFRDAKWAQGACMLGCSKRGECHRAIQLCRRLPHCASVNINVEGTVATLKRESELSAKTSKGKSIVFSQNKEGAALGRDKACSESDVALHVKENYATCILACPKLNCTAATALCYKREDCIAIDIAFGFQGHGAVARLRFT